mgnify:FL=1
MKKEIFIKKLNKFFEDLSSGAISLKIQEILNNVAIELGGVIYVRDAEKASQKILDIEFSTREKIETYKQTIKLVQPRGFFLNKRVAEDYNSYLIEFEKLETNL